MSFLDSTYLNYKEDQNIKSYTTYRTLIKMEDSKLTIGNVYYLIHPVIDTDQDLYYDLIPESIYLNHYNDKDISLEAKDYAGHDITIFVNSDMSLLDTNFYLHLLGVGYIIPEWIIPHKKVKLLIKYFDKTYTFITEDQSVIQESEDFFKNQSTLLDTIIEV